MEEEYLILQCPACERSVKIKSEAAGTRMGCPYCKEPIEVSAAVNEEVPDDPDDSDPPPLAFRKIEGSAPSSKHAPSDDAGAPKGERRKQRKRLTEAPDWDENAANLDQEKDRASDDDSSEFLEMDPDSPGGVRLKRVRRKKILTTKDKFIRGLVLTGSAFAVAIVGFIIFSAAKGILNVAVEEGEMRRELPLKIRELIEAANRPTTDLTQDEELIAAEILSGFLNAKTIDERLQYVRDQKRVKPLMEKWYAENPEEASREWPDAEIILRKKIIDRERYFVILAVEFVEIGKRVLAIEQNKETGEMRIDWETTVGYQPMPLEEFKSQRPTKPVKFWVKVKPSDFYNHNFSDPLKYQAVELSYPGRGDFKLVGYFDRQKEWAKILQEKLEAGNAPSLIVELAYPEGEIKDGSQVEINSIVADTWWP
jgi:hypothetical protein